MQSLNWNTLSRMLCTIVGVLLSTVLTSVLSTCPKDVSTKAHSCFTAYSLHFQNMQRSPQKLCCGVDVETVRAFCQSYMSAMNCVNQLKASCPRDTHHVVDKALINLDGAHAGLQELCSDDSIIETYAMYQSCFTFAGSGSEQCFQAHLSSTGGHNIRFLSKVSTHSKDQFCSAMRHTVACVQRNVRNMCGEEAARLAAILVKPMVRQSTDCDYSVINDQQKTTKQPHHGQHAYISDGHDTRSGKDKDGGGRNSSTDVKRCPYVMTVTSLLLILLFLQRQFL